MVNYSNTLNMRTFYQLDTTNASFRDMHIFLKDTGIQNNRFFLVLLDSDLAGVNPRDPRLNIMMKSKVLRECVFNYWYFLREVIRIPDQGGDKAGGMQYRLHRGNLALNFCLINNYNVFAEFPRQHGKTIAVVCRFLWEFLFGTTNSEMMMINKKHQDSKDNLLRLKNIRDSLPTYLQMKEQYGKDGKKLKVTDSVETLENAQNGNKIRTLPAARNRVAANSLGRGCTQPRQWYDEYAFIPFNNIIYLSATPAYKTASLNAKRNNAPYGIIITTTPGDLTTEEGMDAFHVKENATKFSETWYDMSKERLDELIAKNEDSAFVYIRFTYQQLGSDESWFKQMVIDMKKDWSAIRREVLLEWSTASDNSPFKKEDLNIVKALIREPIKQVTIGRYYQINIYKELNPRTIPIIGVDVSGGFKRDSSAITIIDSDTTEVAADFNCNYISTIDLAGVIYELVTKHMSNAVVNIERNGGFGSSVLAKLLSTTVKRNLFYEIKDKVIEERYDGINTNRKTQKTKVYGLDSNGKVRDLLMQILRERMDYHKDKFISPIIYKELETLEVKRNGRIEHTSTGHDDQIFSYLMALYVWYEGKDVMERWGIQKKTIKTDQDLEEAVVQIEDRYSGLAQDIETITRDDNVGDMINEQLEFLNSNKSISYEEWLRSQTQHDENELNKAMQNKLFRNAYAKKYNINPNDLEMTVSSIPNSVFTDFYN